MTVIKEARPEKSEFLNKVNDTSLHQDTPNSIDSSISVKEFNVPVGWLNSRRVKVLKDSGYDTNTLTRGFNVEIVEI